MMNKRDLILNALQELLREGKGNASVMDIARKAGIAKGGMYYYFKNKEAALDALAQRQYETVIETSKIAVEKSEGNALEKLKILLFVYKNTAVNQEIDNFLHQTENAAIHQKSMAFILLELSNILTDIFKQGVEEGVFVCEKPREYSEIMLSAMVFLLDPGLFTWSYEQVNNRLKAIATLMEKGLCCEKGSFSFIYENWKKQTLI